MGVRPDPGATMEVMGIAGGVREEGVGIGVVRDLEVGSEVGEVMLVGGEVEYEPLSAFSAHVTPDFGGLEDSTSGSFSMLLVLL